MKTLEVADKAVRLAINKANELELPLIVCGDLHDTKAHLRSECVNAMIETFTLCQTDCLILRGNHCSLNEKSDKSVLVFLNSETLDSDGCQLRYTEVLDKPRFNNVFAYKGKSIHMIPYHHDVEELRKYLKSIDKGSLLIMHQGIQGSNAGEYFQDKSALRPEDVAGFRVISGHYHTRQTIDLPDGGRWDYVGNPFSLNFAEANDPPKGFQILYDDGSLEFVPTNLRKHIVGNIRYDNERTWFVVPEFNDSDLLWIKVTGPPERVKTLTKQEVNKMLGAKQDFKLELISDEVKTEVQHSIPTSQPELLDSLIDSLSSTTPAQKQRLKAIWKDLCDNA